MIFKNLRIHSPNNLPYSIIEWKKEDSKFKITYGTVKDIESNYYLIFQICLLRHLFDAYNEYVNRLTISPLEEYHLPSLNGTIEWL